MDKIDKIIIERWKKLFLQWKQEYQEEQATEMFYIKLHEITEQDKFLENL